MAQTIYRSRKPEEDPPLLKERERIVIEDAKEDITQSMNKIEKIQNGCTVGDLSLALICVLIFCFSLTALYIKYEPSLSDTAFFGGDTWEYQSLAVNLYLGHGYKFGNAENFGIYKFDNSTCIINHVLDKNGEPTVCYEQFNKGAYYSFYRTPGYPIFLALVYKVFGVHPQYAKIMQMVLLAFSISVFPWIGRHYWSNLGILSGVVAALFVLYTYLLTAKPNYLDPTNILSEPLIVFGLSLWAVTSVFWEKKTTRTRTFFLGVASAVILLIKGVTVFVPFLFLLYMALKIRNTRTTLRLGFAFFIGCCLLLLPWSIYAYEKSGRIILVSMQFDEVLLAGNNEDTIDTGLSSLAWHVGSPEKYLYQRLRETEYSSVRKVFIFLNQNKKSIPTLLKNKLWGALSSHWLVISLMLAYYLRSLINRFKIRTFPPVFDWWSKSTVKNHFICLHATSQRPVVLDTRDASSTGPCFPLVFFINILMVTVIFFNQPRYFAPFAVFFTLPASYFVLSLLASGVLKVVRVQ